MTIRQIYQQNIYDASQRTRYFSGNLAGSWKGISVNGTYDRRQVFFGETNSNIHGNAPRIAVNRAARRLFGSPVYFSFNSEFGNRPYQQLRDGEVIQDRGIGKLDVTPQIRAPLTKWPFLNITSSLTWRGTYYTESLDERGRQVDEPIFRRYFDMRAEAVGPILTRVFDTPGSDGAGKLKHLIEPTFGIQRVTPIENRESIVLLNDSGDYVVGNTTRITYGLTNRLLSKHREGGQGAGGRQVLSVAINQSYYSDPRASQFDDEYSTSFRGRRPSKFSPVSLNVRGTPSDRINAVLRLEYDPEVGAVQSVHAQGEAALGEWLHANAGWSQRRLRTSALDLEPINFDNYINGQTSLRTRNNGFGGTYSFNFDVGRGTMLQQRIVAYYHAQCCGFAVEYQTFDFPESDRFRVDQDRRFNFSFTLAGIGTFSNLLGAFGGQNQP